MATEFRFPDVGEGITEGHLVKWLVKEGDKVKADQPIAEVETDKAVVELPAPVSGTVLGLHVQAGSTIKVGDLLVTIGEVGEKPAKKPVAKPAGKPEKKPAKAKRVSVSVVGELPTEAIEVKRLEQVEAPPREKVLALPAVRKLAKDLGVEISAVKGTGAKGRVTEEDVRASAKAKAPGIGEEVEVRKTEIPAGEMKVTFDKYGRILWVPVTPTRKAIIRNVTVAGNIPVACGMMDADITELSNVRETKKGYAEKKGIKLTFLAFIVRAVVAALKKHPFVNSELYLEKGVIMNKNYYNIGIAVETAYGLMVPVIKKADSKSILSIAHDVEVLAENARTRKISLDDLKGGTFTITNYGSVGGNYGVPMLNPPEVAILGVGRAEDKPVVRNGKTVVRKILPLSLTFDHRVVDGAEATRFLHTMVKHLEDPNLLLIDID